MDNFWDGSDRQLWGYCKQDFTIQPCPHKLCIEQCLVCGRNQTLSTFLGHVSPSSTRYYTNFYSNSYSEELIRLQKRFRKFQPDEGQPSQESEQQDEDKE